MDDLAYAFWLALFLLAALGVTAYVALASTRG
jgi:hypothetical protein